MMKKNFVKYASVLLIATFMILSTIVVSAETKEKNNNNPATKDILFEDGFETYADFSIDFPPWTLIDLDGSPHFSHSLYTWPNQGVPQSFTIFNPSMTTPPMTETEGQPHSGDKYAACFNANNVGYINDDWMISPLIDAADFDALTVWAKSFSDQYNYDQFEVGISTTDTDPSSFDIITSPIQPGHTAWEEHIIDLNAYDGMAIYIGFHCISVDAWFLMIDDITVTGGGGGPTLVPDLDCSGSIEWVDINPGATVFDTFEIENIGDPESNLAWEVAEYPDWGNWSANPDSGTGLTPEEGPLSIMVTVTAPNEENTEFTGEIKIVNSNNESDFCIISVSLATPLSQQANNFPILQRILERFPNVLPIVQKILGL